MASRLTLASAHDLDLAAQCRAGDRAAFGELVRRHGSAVRTFVRRMGADSATADDVAQDAFLTAFEQIADFRGEGAFQGWLKRIAGRAYARRWRREGGSTVRVRLTSRAMRRSPRTRAEPRRGSTWMRR